MNTQHRRPTGASATSSVSDRANVAQDKFSDSMGQAQEFAQDQYDKLTTSIRRNPLQAAGVAAGVGFVLALLARR